MAARRGKIFDGTHHRVASMPISAQYGDGLAMLQMWYLCHRDKDVRRACTRCEYVKRSGANMIEMD